MGKMEQRGYDRTYCYPQTNVLKNKLNIKDDAEKLECVVNAISVSEIAKIEKDGGVKGNFDFEHYLKIHKAIFGKIFEWAGEIRTVDIAKADSNMFCHKAYIFDYAKDVFRNVNIELYKKLPREDFVATVAELFGDLNALHPFREGNGRTERVFLRQIAKECGYQIDFTRVSKEQYIKASKDSMLCDYLSSYEMFNSIVREREILPEKKEDVIAQKNKTIQGKNKSKGYEH